MGAGGCRIRERLKEMGLFRLEETGWGRPCHCLQQLNRCSREERAKVFLRDAQRKDERQQHDFH